MNLVRKVSAVRVSAIPEQGRAAAVWETWSREGQVEPAMEHWPVELRESSVLTWKLRFAICGLFLLEGQTPWGLYTM